MLINEVSKLTNLTKKAIEYYVTQKLVNPKILPNGYRDFNEADVECLKSIYFFRKLGLSIEEIRCVLADESNNTLQKILLKKELIIKREQANIAMIGELIHGKICDELSLELETIEKSLTVTDKLLEAFPGYYGRFICLHFARFLNEPITTAVQQTAYEEIIEFLDNVPVLEFDEDLQSFILESTNQITFESIHEVMENTMKSIEDPDKFLSENKEVIEQYLAYKQSEEYKDSSIYKFQKILKEFNQTSGYYDVFIPAMKKLSASYSEYYKQLEMANEKVLLQYPYIETRN